MNLADIVKDTVVENTEKGEVAPKSNISGLPTSYAKTNKPYVPIVFSIKESSLKIEDANNKTQNLKLLVWSISRGYVSENVTRELLKREQFNVTFTKTHIEGLIIGGIDCIVQSMNSKNLTEIVAQGTTLGYPTYTHIQYDYNIESGQYKRANIHNKTLHTAISLIILDCLNALNGESKDTAFKGDVDYLLDILEIKKS